MSDGFSSNNECMGWVVWYEECARESQSFPTQEVNEWRPVANAFPSVRRHVFVTPRIAQRSLGLGSTADLASLVRGVSLSQCQ